MKAAVVGCGRMGAEPSARLEGQIPAGWLPIAHAEAIREVEGVDLVALCDTDRERLLRCGKHYGVSALYDDFRRLLDEVRPDLLAVATRTPSKAEILEEACRRGVRGIYVEKPLANSLEGCRALLAAAERSGVRLGYGVNRRYHAVYRLAKRMLQEGEIGELVEIVVEHGPGQLFWAHPHAADLMLFLSGRTDVVTAQATLRADSVAAVSPKRIDSDPVIDNAFFSFGNGMTAGIVRSSGWNVRVGGSEGNLVVYADGSSIQVNKKSKGSAYFLDQRTLTPPVKESATVVAFRELVHSMVEGTQPPIAPTEIETGMRMLLGCVWSHLQGGLCIDLREVPQDLFVSGKFGKLYA